LEGPVKKNIGSALQFIRLLKREYAMRSKIILLSALRIAALQFCSCQGKSFDPTLAGDFFPLRPGLSWTYRIIDSSHGTTHILTDRVLGWTGAQSSEVESEYSGPSGVLKSSISYIVEHGYFTRQSTINNRPGTVLAERAFLPQLLKPNLSWSNSLVPFVEEPDLFHVRQTHQTFFDTTIIEVPAGSFSGCIRIETLALYQSSFEANPSLRLKYVDWYAPHIGLIKTVVEQTGLFGSEVARIELLRFGDSRPKRTPSPPVSAWSPPIESSYNSSMGR
jgi:hypothetical protein